MDEKLKYTVLIVDDESKIREVLRLKLERICPQVNTIEQASNVDEAYEKITRINPDIVFLDILMPGATGFDLLDKFDKIPFEVIFATGYNEYALEALKLSAVDYILKPFKTSDIKSAVIKALQRLEQKMIVDKYDTLKHNMINIGKQEARIAIPGATHFDFVQVKNIIRCEGWQKYTKVHLSSGKIVVSSFNIGVFCEMLKKYNFFSTHKSHFINIKHIDKVLKDGTVLMSDESVVPVARRRKDDFLRFILK